MYITLKEVRETNYLVEIPFPTGSLSQRDPFGTGRDWLRILSDENFIKTSRIEDLKNESVGIIKLVTSIIKSNQNKKVINNLKIIN